MKRLNDQGMTIVQEEALSWVKAMEAGMDEKEKEALSQWTRRSAAHRDTLLMEAALHPVRRKPDLIDTATLGEWVRLARAEPEADQTAPGAPAEVRAADRPRTRRWLDSGWPLAACVAVLASALVLIWQWQARRDGPAWTMLRTEATSRPETLDDGSKLILHPHSQLAIRYTADLRELRLTQGGASFDVQADPNRGFRVNVNGGAFEVLGTQFNVRYGHGQVSAGIFVKEGRVRARGDGGVEKYLGAGQSTEITREGGVGPIEQADVLLADALPATPGNYETTTLGELAAALNRRNGVPQFNVIGPAADKSFQVIRNLDDPKIWLRMLKDRQDLDVEDSGDTVTIRAKDSAR